MAASAAVLAPSVFAVVVAYEPELERLAEVLGAVLPQVQHVLLVDNSESVASREAVAALVAQQDMQFEHLVLHRPEINIGLSAAYNRAIAQAQTAQADYLLLLDQDSVIAGDMVAALLSGLLRASEQAQGLGMQGKPVTVGPWYSDDLSGRRSVILRTGAVSLNRVSAPDVQPTTQLAELPVMPTEMLISSGSLLPMSAFVELGMLDETLFIDHIDTDWALRVRHAGEWMAVIPEAQMRHRLGDKVQRVWWGRDRLLPVHSPLRLYYIYRNSLWLYGRPHAHWRWVLFDLKRLLAIALIHTVAAGPRWSRLRFAGRGVRHGLLGLLGWRGSR